MRRQSVHLFIVAILALLGPLAQKGRGDFELWDDFQFTVKSGHQGGALHERSGAFIVSGGSVTHLGASDSSTVGISGGYVQELGAGGSSTVNISAGEVGHWFLAAGSSAVNITGGSVSSFSATGSSVVDISGGSVSSVQASDYTVVTLHGRNFSVGDGLLLFGDRVVGGGILSGEWLDGTPWAMNISANIFTATLLAIPESAHKPFCVKYPHMDFNHDCKVDFADFAIMASSWLECNLVPESACWE